MARLCVTEYERMAEVAGGFRVSVGVEPAIAIQNVAFTATAGVSAAFNPRTRFVRVEVDGIASVLFSTAGTAAVAGAGTRMTAGQTEYFGVDAGTGLRVSAVTDT